MAAGLCPQATLEEELEEVLGLEASRGGHKLPFGQELGRGLLAAAGIGDQHGPPADHEGVFVVVGWEAVQGVTAVAVQVLAFGGGVQEPQQRILGDQRAHWMQPGPTVSADGRQEPKPDAELVEQPVAGLGQLRVRRTRSTWPRLAAGCAEPIQHV